MIEVLICTIDERIKNVIHTISTPRPDVCYLVSWQQTSSVQLVPPQELLERNDVRIATIQGKGISANRNNAFNHASGDILIIADDDNSYTDEYFDHIQSAYSEFPDADIIAFKAVDEFGNPYKDNYPSYVYQYQDRPYGSYISSCEITLKRSHQLPKFDERFGLGSQMLMCGEEEIFLYDAYKQNLNIYYVPLTIVSTPRNTTGSLFATCPKVRMSKGAVLRYIHGRWGALFRCIKFALHYTKFNPFKFSKILKDLYQGIVYIK
jgi:glycosyltransferase involved in cell wall biosynthesis